MLPKCRFWFFRQKQIFFDYLIVCIPLKLMENGYVEVLCRLTFFEEKMKFSKKNLEKIFFSKKSMILKRAVGVYSQYFCMVSGAKDIYFWCRIQKSTFRQHLLPKKLLVALQRNAIFGWFFSITPQKATFRQQILPECWPNDYFHFFPKKCQSR